MSDRENDDKSGGATLSSEGPGLDDLFADATGTIEDFRSSRLRKSQRQSARANFAHFLDSGFLDGSWLDWDTVPQSGRRWLGQRVLLRWRNAIAKRALRTIRKELEDIASCEEIDGERIQKAISKLRAIDELLDD